MNEWMHIAHCTWITEKKNELKKTVLFFACLASFYYPIDLLMVWIEMKPLFVHAKLIFFLYSILMKTYTKIWSVHTLYVIDNFIFFFFFCYDGTMDHWQRLFMQCFQMLCLWPIAKNKFPGVKKKKRYYVYPCIFILRISQYFTYF